MTIKREVLNAAKSFEVQVSLKDAQSKKIAWWVAGMAMALAFLSVVALLVALPLKQIEVVVVRVDNVTGRSEIMSTVTNENITQQAAQDRFFTSMYVNLRERYNYYSSQVDYDTVPMYSSEAVSADYLKLWDSDKSPDKVYLNDANVVTIDIISNPVVEANFPDKVATIRYAKKIKNLRSGKIKTEYHVARVTFRMVPSKEMSEEQRTNNPLGFTVVEYRTEKEMRESQ